MACSINVLKLILLISFMFSTYSTFCEPCCCCKKNVKPNLGNSGNSGSSRLINKDGLGEDKKKKDEVEDEGEEEPDSKEEEEKSEDKNSVSEENKSEGEEKSDSKAGDEEYEKEASENSVVGKEESSIDKSEEDKPVEEPSEKSVGSEEHNESKGCSTKGKPMKKKKKPTEEEFIKSIKNYIEKNFKINFKAIADILNRRFEEALIPEFEVSKDKSNFIRVECGKCSFFSKGKIDSLIESFTEPKDIIFDQMWLYVHDNDQKCITIKGAYALAYIVSSLCSLPEKLRPYWSHHYLQLGSDCVEFIENLDIYFDITEGVFYYKDEIEYFSSSKKEFYRKNKTNYGLFCIKYDFSVNANCYSNGNFVCDYSEQPEESSIENFSKYSKRFGYEQLKEKKALGSFYIVS